MKIARFLGLFTLALFLIVSAATAVSAWYYPTYGYYYGAGGYPSYNGHPYAYGPGGWDYSYRSPGIGWYAYGYYQPYNYQYHYYSGYSGYNYYGGYSPGYYYRGYGQPWFYSYWPYSYRVYSRAYP